MPPRQGSVGLTASQSNISKRDPKSQNTLKMERYLTSDLRPSNKSARDVMEQSRFVQGLLKTLAVFGVSLVLADSILTPAQSVLGAIQGESDLFLALTKRYTDPW